VRAGQANRRLPHQPNRRYVNMQYQSEHRKYGRRHLQQADGIQRDRSKAESYRWDQLLQNNICRAEVRRNLHYSDLRLDKPNFCLGKYSGLRVSRQN